MKLYSIGETSKIHNISAKALRFYDEIDILKPRYIDDSTGYRYYSYDQFHIIDKIRRFKNLNIPLKDIRDIIENGTAEKMSKYLENQKFKIEDEIQRLNQMLTDIEWLSKYFTYSSQIEVTDEVVIKQIKEHYCIAVPCEKDENIFDMDMNLRRVLRSSELKDVNDLNPYGYMLDFDDLLQNKLSITHSTVGLSNKPDFQSEYIRYFPEGKYICFRAKILSDSWNVYSLASYFSDICPKPQLVLAEEYVRGFYDYKNSPYEIKILI